MILKFETLTLLYSLSKGVGSCCWQVYCLGESRCVISWCGLDLICDLGIETLTLKVLVHNTAEAERFIKFMLSKDIDLGEGL